MHTHLRLPPQPPQRKVRRNPTREFWSHTADPRTPSEPDLDWSPQEKGCAVLTLAGTSKAWPMLGGSQLCDCGEVTCPGIWAGQEMESQSNDPLPPGFASTYGNAGSEKPHFCLLVKADVDGPFFLLALSSLKGVSTSPVVSFSPISGRLLACTPSTQVLVLWTP